MSGPLRYQIELLTRSETPDAGGGVSVSYAPGVQIWSAVDLLPSINGASGDRTRRLRRVRALIRNRADISLGVRFRFDGADFETVSIESDDAKGRRVFLIGEEVAP
ncbi:MAG TPA: head-tail adaptor protein [Parvularculaceae bacterium]|nr:head-tail adaptor protein [Parvularculaceae bacterium]HNS88153.1 head-tail adaptor protein [Parvularculaceae bacterium]